MQMSVMRLATLAAVFLLTGCGAGDYKPPITAFSAATKVAAASLAEYEGTLDGAALEANLSLALSNPAVLRVTAGDCIPGSTRCRLVIRSRSGEEQPLIPGPIDPNIRRLMAGLVAYSADLEAIVAADTEGEVKAAADAAKGNLISLAKSVDALNKQLNAPSQDLEKAATAFAAPVADAVVYLAGKYVATLKLDALRKATGTMSEIFPTLTTVFGVVADAGMTRKRNHVGRAYDAASLAFASEPRTRPKLDALRVASEAYDAALVTDPKTVFKSLEQAHGALSQALKRPEPTFEMLWPLIQQVAAEAEKLKSIVSALAKAASTTAAQ